MQRLTLRFIIILLTFSVGVAAVALWYLYQIPATEELEEPPRASSVEFGQSHLSSLVSTPHIDLCGLAHNSDRFNQRLVRVQSTFLGDEHHQHIYDSTCGSAGANIQVVYSTGDTRASLIRAICELNRAGCDRGFLRLASQ
jgi:hypothetical protein